MSTRQLLDFLLTYDEIRSLSNEIIAVRKDGKWGLFSLNEEEGRVRLHLDVQYDDIEAVLPSVLFLVRHEDRVGLYSVEDEMFLIPVEFQEIKKFGYPLKYLRIKKEPERVGDRSTLGLFSVERKETELPPEYEKVEHLPTDGMGFGDLVELRKGDLVGVFSVSGGKFVLPVKFDRFEEAWAKRGLYHVGREGKFGLFFAVDGRNEFILSVRYDEVERLDHNLFRVGHDGRVGVFSLEGEKFVLPLEYTRIEWFTSSRLGASVLEVEGCGGTISAFDVSEDGCLTPLPPPEEGGEEEA